jgi:hypothetical protein
MGLKFSVTLTRKGFCKQAKMAWVLSDLWIFRRSPLQAHLESSISRNFHCTVRHSYLYFFSDLEEVFIFFLIWDLSEKALFFWKGIWPFLGKTSVSFFHGEIGSSIPNEEHQLKMPYFLTTKHFLLLGRRGKFAFFQWQIPWLVPPTKNIVIKFCSLTTTRQCNTTIHHQEILHCQFFLTSSSTASLF